MFSAATIPSQLGRLTSMTSIEAGSHFLHDTKIGGKVPTQLGKMSKLKRFTIAENSLTGSFPTQLGNLDEVAKYFQITSNQFCSDMPTEVSRAPLELSTLFAKAVPTNGHLASLVIQPL